MDQGAVVACLGCQCWVTHMGRSLGLLSKDGPFDWVAVSPKMVRHMLETNFHELENSDNLVPVGRNKGRANHKVYSPMLAEYGFPDADMFQHVPLDGDLYGAITRRVGRFRKLIQSGAPIVFVIGLAVQSDASRLLDIFNHESWELFHWLQGVLTNFHMVAIFCECNAPQYWSGTKSTNGLGADNKYVFLNMQIPGQLRGAHFVGRDVEFVRAQIQAIIHTVNDTRHPHSHPYRPPVGGHQTLGHQPAATRRWGRTSHTSHRPPVTHTGHQPLGHTSPATGPPPPDTSITQPSQPSITDTVLVLIDSYYKVKSKTGHFLNRLHEEMRQTPWKADVVKLPGWGLGQMREELEARSEHLHLYAGVLVISMGNDLTTKSWDNLSETQFVDVKPALRLAISGMATLLRPLKHHYIVYGGAGKFWWCSSPSQTLGATFDERRDWVVNKLKGKGVHASTGESALTKAGYTVDDVDRFHHKTSGSEKALTVLLQWIVEACGVA